MTDVKDDKNAQEYALPESFGCCFHISPPSVDLKAQMRIAIQAMGTMIDLAMNSQRRLFGCMHRNGKLISQKMKKLIMVFVSIPWLSGIEFLRVRKDGQMAPIITLMLLAPFMF